MRKQDSRILAVADQDKRFRQIIAGEVSLD